ncbi:MAG: methyltransferase [Rothia sp. (in: high G+C Gram-positive bacteria)]|nr:methyltransferase [Rothia sp. (in: high G+C Gram-positive bacteria)]
MSAQHYFSSSPDSDFKARTLSLDLAGHRVEVSTAAGIFSPAGLDKGSAVLLDKVPAPVGKLVLDIGSGWGPLTLALALKLPQARVIAVEVNQRSAELTRLNAARLGLDRVEVFQPDQVDPQLRFDTIWSNPPIRVGKQALHKILLTWLPRLAPGGQAYLVVQKNLGADSLQAWLADRLEKDYPGRFAVSRYGSSKGFRLLRCASLH